MKRGAGCAIGIVVIVGGIIAYPSVKAGIITPLTNMLLEFYPDMSAFNRTALEIVPYIVLLGILYFGIHKMVSSIATKHDEET